MSSRTRKEDMWAQSTTTTTDNENNTPTSPPESTPATSPAKSNSGSSIDTNEGSNSTKASLTPASQGSHSGNHTPDTEGLPQMPNVSRVSEYEAGFEPGGEGSGMLGFGHQQHADALTRALSQISLHGDTTPRALKTAVEISAMN